MNKTKVAHDEVKKFKILVQLCAESTFGEFWWACRRRPNLTVGYAALWQGELHMASRDGLGRTEAVGNSNILLLAGQIVVFDGSQLFVEKLLKIANCAGSNHRIAKPRRQNSDLKCSFIHARPQLPENSVSKV